MGVSRGHRENLGQRLLGQRGGRPSDPVLTSTHPPPPSPSRSRRKPGEGREEPGAAGRSRRSHRASRRGGAQGGGRFLVALLKAGTKAGRPHSQRTPPQPMSAAEGRAEAPRANPRPSLLLHLSVEAARATGGWRGTRRRSRLWPPACGYLSEWRASGCLRRSEMATASFPNREDASVRRTRPGCEWAHAGPAWWAL